MMNIEAATSSHRSAAQLREDLRGCAAALVASGVGTIAIGRIAEELTAAERAESTAAPRAFRVWYRAETSPGRTAREIETVTAIDSLAAREAIEAAHAGCTVFGVDPA